MRAKKAVSSTCCRARRSRKNFPRGQSGATSPGLNLPGSMWLPDTGYGALAAPVEDYLSRVLRVRPAPTRREARDLLPGRLLDVVERGETSTVLRLLECRLVSGRDGWMAACRAAACRSAAGAATRAAETRCRGPGRGARLTPLQRRPGPYVAVVVSGRSQQLGAVRLAKTIFAALIDASWFLFFGNLADNRREMESREHRCAGTSRSDGAIPYPAESRDRARTVVGRSRSEPRRRI